MFHEIGKFNVGQIAAVFKLLYKWVVRTSRGFFKNQPKDTINLAGQVNRRINKIKINYN